MSPGCGDLSHDVSRSRLYQSGGVIPSHIYRLKTDALVVADPKYPDLRYLRRSDFKPSPGGFFKLRPVWRVPAGSKLCVDYLHHFLIRTITEDNFIEVYGSILDDRHDELSVRRSTFIPEVTTREIYEATSRSGF